MYYLVIYYLVISDLLFYLVSPDAQCGHQRVAQYLLSERPSLQGLHGQHGDVLVGVGMSQSLAYLIIYMLSIWHHDEPFHLLGIADHL